MRKREGKIKNIYFKNKDVIYFSLILLVIFIFYMGYQYVFKSHKNYVVEQGYISISSESIGYFLKNDTIVETDKTKSIISVAQQGARVSKGEVVAIYKNGKYDEYIQKINDMDKKIADALRDLAPVYSNDISVIDTQIEEFIKKSKEANSSYIKIQENKNKINELTYKRNLIVSELSPNGAVVKELIKERDNISKESKNAADNIIATKSGLVTYKIDGLEDSFSFGNILGYDIDDMDSIFEKFENNTISQTGIKIVNNYDSYMIIKEKRGINDQYISQGKKYSIKINDKNATVSGQLVKLTQDDNYNYCIFEIVNGIENLVDARAISVEIAWKTIEGMIIPSAAIKEDENGKYLLVIRNGEYVKIYIEISISSDNMSILKNSTSEQNAQNKISLYDRIVID